MKSTVAIVTGALLLAGCAAPKPPKAPEAPPPPVAAADDECHAADWQKLIGRPRSDIPKTPAGAKWRIACSTCAVTMDFVPDRLTITYDDKTGLVTKLGCG